MPTLFTYPFKCFTLLEVIGGCSNLRDIYCTNLTPPICHGSVFSDATVESCILHIPQGSREVYTIADSWCDFKKIIEDELEIEPSDYKAAYNELLIEVEKLRLGDLNQDGHTDINDVALLLSMDTYESDPSALANLTDGTSITSAEIAERYGDVEYYTLDGTKVSEPTKSGIYLVKQGGETKMIVVKK